MTLATDQMTRSPHARSSQRPQGVWALLQENLLYRVVARLPKAVMIGSFIAVPLLWLMGLHLMPLLKMGQIAFYAEYPLPVGQEQTLTTRHFSAFFENPNFRTPLLRTFTLAAATSALTLLVALPIGWLIARHSSTKSQLRKLLILMAPFWAGELVRAFALVLVGANKGLINETLKALGVIETPIPLLYNTGAVHFGMFYFLILYQTLPLYNAMTKIPVSVSEAAADLGAGPWRRFAYVTLPLLRPAIASSTALVFLMSLGAYSVPLLLGGNDSVLFAQTIATIFNSGSNTWPQGAAFSVIFLVLAFVAAAIWFRLVAGKGEKV